MPQQSDAAKAAEAIQRDSAHAEGYTLLPQVKDWVISREPSRGLHTQAPLEVLVLSLGSGPAQTFVHRFDRESLIELAREILRKLDPTTEQEILEALNRIEAKLPETQSPAP